MPHDVSPDATSTPQDVPVGTRVHLTAASGGGSGFIVEDFGPLPTLTDQQPTTAAARPRRYAVALDDGTLLFLDDHEFDTTTDE